MAEPADSTFGRFVFLNGAIVSIDDAKISISDQGLLFGFGFFESFRTSRGRPHLWNLHRRRLEQACATAALALPTTLLVKNDERLLAAVGGLLRHAGVEDAAFRYTVTAGASGAPPSEFLTMRPLPAPPPPEGICLRVLKLARDSGEWRPRPKSLNYLNASLGARELAERATHASDEGLFLSGEGSFVVETTRQNVAWVVDGRICYPDPAIGPLAGICLSWLRELGGEVHPCVSPLPELMKADAVFVLNAVRGITPVRQICDQRDDVLRELPESAANPLVVSLRRQWQESLATVGRAS